MAARTAYTASMAKAAKSYRKYPHSRWADDALFLIARARFQLGDYLPARAAFAASKLHPLPAGIREDEDGNRVTYEVSDLGPDRSAYVAFREAVTTLLDAFEPEGIRAVSTDTLIRLSDQLAGVALGALGDRGLLAFAGLADEAKRYMTARRRAGPFEAVKYAPGDGMKTIPLKDREGREE